MFGFLAQPAPLPKKITAMLVQNGGAHFASQIGILWSGGGGVRPPPSWRRAVSNSPSFLSIYVRGGDTAGSKKIR